MEREYSKSVFYAWKYLITETTECKKDCVIICTKKQRQSNRGVNQVSKGIIIDLEQYGLGAYYEQ